MKFKCSPFEGHVQLVTAVAFSSEGTNICSASADGTCRVWRIEDATCYFVLEGDKRVASCNFSADSKMIITGDWGYHTRVWDAVFGQPVMSLAGHHGKLTASRFRPDGNSMITASEDKHVRTWDPRRGVSVAYQAPDEMLDCAFHPDSVSIVGACKNGMLLVWDIRKPDETRLEIEAHGTDWVTCCALSASGGKALTSSTDRTMKLWNMDTGEHLQTFSGHQEAVNGCRFLGDYVVSGAGNRFWGSKDNTVVVWDPCTGQSFRTLKGHGDAVMGIDTYCQNGKVMVVGASMDKSVRLWNCMNPPDKRKKDDKGGGKGVSIDCKFGCGIQLPADRLTQHEELCPQRVTSCPSCRKEMTYRDLESHSSECTENEYACVCNAKVRNRDRKKHERDECPMREVQCTQGCGMMMKAPSLDAHIKTFCQERLVKCRIGCGASVAAKSLVTHQQNGCQNRDVTCELCKSKYVAKDGDQHKRRFCTMREVQCRLGCNKRFPAQQTEDHEMTSCSMRLVNCRKGCGHTCAAKDQASHERDCKGSPVVSDSSLLRYNRPLSSIRPRPLENIFFEGEKSTLPTSVGSPRIPGLNESPTLKHWARPHNGTPDHFGGRSPERNRTKCNACGHHERHCSGCCLNFCSRCLVRSGLPKSNPPLCATCSRENNMRTRELLAKSGPSPMRFGGGPKPL